MEQKCVINHLKMLTKINKHMKIEPGENESNLPSRKHVHCGEYKSASANVHKSLQLFDMKPHNSVTTKRHGFDNNVVSMRVVKVTFFTIKCFEETVPHIT